jgi:hypothetical protein
MDINTFKGILMKKNKLLPFLIVSAIVSACSSNINSVSPVNKNSIYSAKTNDKILTIKEIADFNQEYTFSTKELTGSYLKRKIEKWLDTANNPSVPDGPKLLKEIAYARYKYSDLFCGIINDPENVGMMDLINSVQAISGRKAIDTPFATFMNTGCTPVSPSGEFRVHTYTTDNQRLASVAMDNAGDFVVAWASLINDGSQYGIFAQRYGSTGLPVGSEFQVNTYTTGTQINPAVAMDSNGDFVVTWNSSQEGNGNGIYAQIFYSDGSRNGSEFMVNTYTTGQQQNSSVAMDDNGDFVVTWHSYNQEGSNSRYGIYAQRYNSDGSKPLVNGSEFQVNTYTTNTQTNPSAAMDDNGDFVISWQSSLQDTSYYGVYAQKYHSDGSPNGSEFQVNTFTFEHQANSSAAMDSSGNFIISWQDSGHDGSGTGIYAQRYNADGSKPGTNGAEFQVNTYITGAQANPSVAMDNNGNFVISWHDSNQEGSGFESGIYAQRFDSAGFAQGTEFHVNTYTSNSQDFPVVAMDSNGDFVVAWNSSQEGTPYTYDYDCYCYYGGYDTGIYARRYNATGEAL